ncbi:MAG TPA: calcium-binding protein [Terriglobales bacterium]|nr:calcium-binding protein [Terriglobales bacterium]
MMKRLKENKTRERRIETEIVVGAYNGAERAMGWYYCLEERLDFQFKATCKSKREISPYGSEKSWKLWE